MKANPEGKVGSIPDPVRFRAQATGIGQTCQASESTGRARSQAVIDCAPAAQRRFAYGYPTPLDDAMSGGYGHRSY